MGKSVGPHLDEPAYWECRQTTRLMNDGMGLKARKPETRPRHGRSHPQRKLAHHGPRATLGLRRPAAPAAGNHTQLDSGEPQP
jgi:hypothetical protein